MPLDQTPIGHLAAQLMEEIEQVTSDSGEIGTVCVIVEATTPDGQSRLFAKFSDPRIHVQLGILEMTRLLVERTLPTG